MGCKPIDSPVPIIIGMKILKAYKTEIRPNDRQRTLLLKHAGVARFAFNWGLNEKKKSFDLKERIPNAIELHRRLNAIKSKDFPWMYEVSKCSPQEALRNLDRAFDNFFRRCKAKKAGTFKGNAGFPKFKSKHRGIGSFRLTGTIHVNEKSVQLPRLGELRLKEKSYIPADNIKILSATVSERAGRWFVSIQVEQEVPDPPTKPTAIAGVDLGIKTLATVSDGTRFENPKALRSRLKKLKRLSKAVSRKNKGGRNRKKAIRRLARLHYKISNIRKDSIHQITTALTKTKSCVGIEDLYVSGMLKNHCLAQAVADLGLGEFRTQLKYKGKLYGCGIVIADRFFPSSKMCHVCGYINESLALSNREWTCDCGAVHDRDFNASKNLENLAVSSTERLNVCGGDAPLRAA